MRRNFRSDADTERIAHHLPYNCVLHLNSKSLSLYCPFCPLWIQVHDVFCHSADSDTRKLQVAPPLALKLVQTAGGHLLIWKSGNKSLRPMRVPRCPKTPLRGPPNPGKGRTDRKEGVFDPRTTELKYLNPAEWLEGERRKTRHCDRGSLTDLSPRFRLPEYPSASAKR